MKGSSAQIPHASHAILPLLSGALRPSSEGPGWMPLALGWPRQGRSWSPERELTRPAGRVLTDCERIWIARGDTRSVFPPVEPHEDSVSRPGLGGCRIGQQGISAQNAQGRAWALKLTAG